MYYVYSLFNIATNSIYRLIPSIDWFRIRIMKLSELRGLNKLNKYVDFVIYT